MSVVLPTASVILGCREHRCFCTYHGWERNAKVRRAAQGSSRLSLLWPPGYSRKRRKASIRCSGSEQDSFRKDEGNGLAGQLTGANSPLRAPPKVAPTHEGLVGRNPSGETSKEADASGDCIVDPELPSEQKRVGSDLKTLIRRFWKVAAPYWSSEDKVQARLRLAGVFALTLATTGISVGFNFLGRDFYNALASKDEERFRTQLLYYLGAFIAGIPVFVFRDYGRETLSLRWRAWMTKFYMSRYFDNRTFYNIQSQSLIDNPDQRIVDDLNAFTGTALSFALAIFNATIDLISFSGILYGIYPPLFGVLIVYSLGGTAISVALGKGLVGLNFMQEKREADFRYGLVRVRENAESIAFYGGELNEIQLLIQRFKESFNNYSKLLIASRNLDFFTSGYRYLIQLLPAAVVAPLYFAGKIEFGVINQSFSAFNHILGDFSIIVYQFQSISAFSAVVDRLGEFSEILDQQNGPLEESAAGDSTKDAYTAQISLLDMPLKQMDREQLHGQVLLEICNLTLRTPQNTMTLVNDLSLRVHQGEHLLVMGASGTGKTSLLRAVAGLWRSGDGTIKRYVRSEQNEVHAADGTSQEELSTAPAPNLVNSDVGVFFVPQRPYMVLGTLRQQLLYPTWTQGPAETASEVKDSLFFLGKPESHSVGRPIDTAPDDDELLRTLEKVRLEHLMSRCDGLDSRVEWSSVLSLGEQQRLAFARLLLTRPALALMDESTSALDESNEAHLYTQVKAAGVTFVSVGHRSTLLKYHTHILQLTDSQDTTGCKWTVSPIQERLPHRPEIQTTSRSD